MSDSSVCDTSLAFIIIHQIPIQFGLLSQVSTHFVQAGTGGWMSIMPYGFCWWRLISPLPWQTAASQIMLKRDMWNLKRRHMDYNGCIHSKSIVRAPHAHQATCKRGLRPRICSCYVTALKMSSLAPAHLFLLVYRTPCQQPCNPHSRLFIGWLRFSSFVSIWQDPMHFHTVSAYLMTFIVSNSIETWVAWVVSMLKIWLDSSWKKVLFVSSCVQYSGTGGSWPGARTIKGIFSLPSEVVLLLCCWEECQDIPCNDALLEFDPKQPILP